MKFSIASDHAGFELKEILKGYLESIDISYFDCGTYSNESCDYPDYAHEAAKMVANKQCEFGIVICGSANGVSMTANKHRGIRAALCWIPEIAALARAHNDANILGLPARYLKFEEAIAIVDAFINTPFEGGRHQNRVNKIDCKE